MLNKRFIIIQLALRNLSKQRFQSIILFALLLITSITLFFSGYLTLSMRDGLLETKERLGADLIVVPNRFVSSIEDALFIGKPCTVNFDKEWLNKIAKTKGVKQVSYQLYIASLSMDCCESSSQLIAFDKDSDFVITPWLSKKGSLGITEDTIILGNNMKKKIGEKIKFFGHEFTVIDVLEETGMGYDNCAFITYEAAYNIANDPRYENVLPFRKNEKVISMVLVKLMEEQTISSIKTNINDTYGKDEIAVYSTSELVSKFSDNLSNFEIYGTVFRTLFLFLATVALYGIYSLTVHLRKSEFGTFISFGTSKKILLLVLIAELFLLILLGTAAGIGFVCIFVFPFHELIKVTFSIPYLMPEGKEIVSLALKTLLINAIVCVVASVKTFYELVHLEAIRLIKPNND